MDADFLKMLISYLTAYKPDTWWQSFLKSKLLKHLYKKLQEQQQ